MWDEITKPQSSGTTWGDMSESVKSFSQTSCLRSTRQTLPNNLKTSSEREAVRISFKACAITPLHLWERSTAGNSPERRLSASHQLSVFSLCLFSKERLSAVVSPSPPEEKQTDAIAISLGERQHRCVNKARLLQSEWSLSKQWLCGGLCGSAVIPGHGCTTLPQDSKQTVTLVLITRGGSDHPDTENE